MKKKFSKILGVGLTLVMVLTMTVAFATPAAAAEDAWSLFAKPVEGVLGSWFMADDIAGLGPFAKAINGDLYLFVDFTAGVDDLYKSTDGGRTWVVTGYVTDVCTTPIVDIACSTEDADTLYVASATDVWKSEAGGDVLTWEEVGPGTIPGAPPITSIAVGYSGGAPYVYIGLTTIGNYAGEVWYLKDAAWFREWIDLELGASALANSDVDVLSVACSPFFDDDTEVDVVVSDDDPYTAVVNNIAGTVAAWTEIVELQTVATGAFEADVASDICYVADFDEEYEFFVGVNNVTAAGDGDVFRICAVVGCGLDLGINADIASLDVVGNWGNTSIVAGGYEVVTAPADIFYSTDDGDTWNTALTIGKAPTGVGLPWSNLVIVDDDFADSGEAWCASDVATKEGGVHRTTDFGATWNGISMIDTDMARTVHDIAFGSDMFMVTESSVAAADDSVWKYDGTYWERVLYDNVNALDLVEVSLEYASDDAVFVADSGAPPVILYSHDAGATFIEMIEQPGAAITSWVVIDYATVITGDAGGNVYKTARYGRRCWDVPIVVNLVANDITDLAISPDYVGDSTILAGDDAALVYISEDEGDTWEVVSTATLDLAAVATIPGATYVAFDPGYATNNTFYCASDDAIGRCVIDAGLDMVDQVIYDMGALAGFATASGLVVSADGVLYAADATALPGVPVAAVAADEFQFGSTIADWGHAWTVSELQDVPDDFRVKVTCTATAGVGLDWIPVTVYYDSLSVQASPTGEFGAFSNADDAYANGGPDADATDGQVNEYWGYDFGAIPALATIRGIEVRVDADRSMMNSGSLAVELSWDGGGTWTSTGYNTGALTWSEQTYNLGGPLDDNGTITVLTGSVVVIPGGPAATVAGNTVPHVITAGQTVPWVVSAEDDTLNVRALEDGTTGAITSVAETAVWTALVSDGDGDVAINAAPLVVGGPLLAVNTFMLPDAVGAITPPPVAVGPTGGVNRCLDPTYALALLEWEVPLGGLTLGETFAGLGAAGTVSNLELVYGSNILYAIDTTAAVDIWTYEDTLVGPPILTLPLPGAFLASETRVDFNWVDLNVLTVLQYDLEVYTEQDWLDGAAASFATTPALSEDIWTTATASTKYVWRVRVSAGQPVASRWTDAAAWSFTTKMGAATPPVQLRPLPGAQDIILRPSFEWLPIVGATSYEIEIATSEDNLLDGVLVTSGTATINAWVIDVELDYSTTYFWRVRAAGAPAGDWVISIFTTVGAPEAPTPPVVITPTPTAPDVEVVIPPTPAPITPAWIYAIIGIGAALAIAVIVLIVRTRRAV